MLHARGIEYAYERRLIAAVVTLRYPDFTIDDEETSRPGLWEHLGLLHDTVYAQRWDRKLRWYAAQGIFPIGRPTSPAAAPTACSSQPAMMSTAVSTTAAYLSTHRQGVQLIRDAFAAFADGQGDCPCGTRREWDGEGSPALAVIIRGVVSAFGAGYLRLSSEENKELPSRRLRSKGRSPVLQSCLFAPENSQGSARGAITGKIGLRSKGPLIQAGRSSSSRAAWACYEALWRPSGGSAD